VDTEAGDVDLLWPAEKELLKYFLSYQKHVYLLLN